MRIGCLLIDVVTGMLNGKSGRSRKRFQMIARFITKQKECGYKETDQKKMRSVQQLFLRPGLGQNTTSD